jgi:cell division protease FtsH
MDDQSQKTRPPVPTWVWIVTIFAIVMGLQLWFSGRFDGPQDTPLARIAHYLQAGQVKQLTVSGSKIVAELRDGTTLSSAKEPNTSVFETFRILGVSDEVLRSENIIIRDLSGWNTFLSLLLPIGFFVLIFWFFTRGMRQMQGGGNNIFGFGRSRAKNITDGDRPTVTFDDVAGVEEAKEDLKEVVQFLREPERFIQVGARIPKGVLMVGPPGTGKTLLARAVAGEAGVPFFHISGSEFVEMFVGVGASRVRDLFNKAKEHAPSIVFVDELDAVGRQRGAGLGGGNDEREQTLNQILVEMDGFSKDTNVIVVAATNRADVLDPALLRPGRFDRKVVVDLPDVRGREAILRIHARGKPMSAHINLVEMARLTAGFSGADLENLVNEAAIFAARRNSREVGLEHFQDAFDRIVMGPERKSRVLSEEDKELVAFHESGHAVLSYNLLYTDPVQKVTIIPRGRAGGFVMTLPEDRLTMSQEHFEDQIAFALGGRAAEEIFFGRVTTGAASDLQQATRIARAMVMQYGMSESLGLRTFGEQNGNVFLGRDFNTMRDYSEDAAKVIDEEVRRILDQNYTRAKRIVQENKDKLVELAQILMRVETLDRESFEGIMNSAPPPTFPSHPESEAAVVL